MTEISRQSLFGKLNPLLFKSLEGATVFCKLRGNPYVELVHWLHQLLQENDCDLIRILRHFDIASDRLAADVLRRLDQLPRGATSISDFSEHIETAIERGWVYATLMFNDSQIRSAYLLSGMVRTRSLANELRSISREFDKISEPALSDAFARLLPDSPEARMRAADGSGLEGTPGEASQATGTSPGQGGSLQQYTVDLTARAKAGEVVLIQDWSINEFRALVHLDAFADRYLYVSRTVDGRLLSLLDDTKATVGVYQQLESERGRVLFNFGLLYLGFALILLGLALAACEKAVQIVYEHGLRPADKLHQPWLDRVTGQLLSACDGLEQAMPTGMDQAGVSTAVAWEFIQKMVPDVVPAARYPRLVAFSLAAEGLPAFRAAPHGDSTYRAG